VKYTNFYKGWHYIQMSSDMDVVKWGDCYQWCSEIFGFEHHTNSRWAYVGNGAFYFADEHDFLLVTLKFPHSYIINKV